jgi:hypothetical protein
MKALAFIVLAALALGAFPCYGQIMPSMVTSSMRVRPNGEVEIKATYKMEPGPSLFQLPADYQIVDEPGPFAITFTFIDKKLVH